MKPQALSAATRELALSFDTAARIMATCRRFREADMPLTRAATCVMRSGPDIHPPDRHPGSAASGRRTETFPGTVLSIAATLVVSLTGCAAPAPSSPVTVAAANATPPQQVCHRERPMGSSILVMKCETAESRAADARAVEQARDQITRDAGVQGMQHAVTGH